MTLSVIVVSYGRADALLRCVLSLTQQACAGAELVVVADPAGLAALRAGGYGDRAILVAQDTPNISAARNAGIRAASGQVLAFIDDDAVAEPTWTRALLEAFEGADLMAATGPVLGRNGISVQWGPMRVNCLGQDQDHDDPEDATQPDSVRKLHGTNMAIRRDAFGQIGGFDEALHFYLDDTDIALRLAQAGLSTAWLPGAVVHHGFAASARRTEDRIPLSLFDIGASTAVFLGKHAPDHGYKALRDLEAAQSSRLLRLTRIRKLNDVAMRGLMESLRDGIADGRARASAVPAVPATPAPASAATKPLVQTDPPAPVVLSGRPHQARRLRREAAEHVADGQPVSLFVFEPTPRKHKVRFTDSGWWEHKGGLFGPSDRASRRFTYFSFNARLAAEIRRISALRGL